MMIDEKLNSIGVKLSDPVPSVGSFIPVVITGNLAFVSGQLPIEPGSNPIQVKYKGKLGRDISLEDGQAAARLCVINGLSELKYVVGNLDNIKKFVKVSGYVNCDPSFTDHAKVINGASDFLVEVFGEKGKHARVSVGASSLALDSSVEIDFIVGQNNRSGGLFLPEPQGRPQTRQDDDTDDTTPQATTQGALLQCLEV